MYTKYAGYCIGYAQQVLSKNLLFPGIVWVGGEHAHQKLLELIVGDTRLTENPAAGLVKTPDAAWCCYLMDDD